MKTLAEVIESITKQSGLEIRNVKKPDKDRFWVDRETYNDALHYLRVYRERQKNLDQFEAYKLALNLRELGNDPLDWDELKLMKGKPVWVDSDNKGHWNIIREVTDCHVIFEIGMPYHKCWQGDLWQAYRKERDNADAA